MFKRISLANTLAVVAASGTFFFIASTAPSDVRNLAAPVARVSAAPLNAVPETDTVFDDNTAQDNVSINDASKGTIDLGEFIIHAR